MPAMNALRKSYSQSQLLLPLLDALSAAPGQMLATTSAYEAVADRIGLSASDRQAEIELKSGTIRPFDRDVRWTRQRAAFQKLIETPSHGHWKLTGKGKDALREAQPGVIITLFETSMGTALYASCEDAAGVIEQGSIRLLMTSPPYPLQTVKQYGNLDAREHVEWLTDLAKGWKRLLAPDGSLVLNLGDTFNSGQPTLSLYAERLLLKLCDELGYHLAQRFEWHSPSRLPAPAEWVCVRRVRVKPSLERIYWLSPSAHPYADNRAVLQPYSDAMRARIAAGGEKARLKPSGHALAQGAFSVDHGGSIPPNLIVASNSESNSRYMADCKAMGLPVHPARFPTAIPEFFIKMLTQKGDTVFDPFGGSGTTAEVAEKLERHWVTSERALEYALGHACRMRPQIDPNLFPGALRLAA